MTWADGYNLRSPDVAKITDIADAIDALCCYPQVTSVSSLTNTTSTTLATLGTASLSITAASGDMVLLLAAASFSCGTANKSIYFTIAQDGTALNPSSWRFFDNVGATDGVRGGMATDHYYYHKPSAGSHTYTLKWCAESGGSGGTIYSLYQELIVIQFQGTL